MNRPRTARKPRPPLDGPALHELALAYVARFATSRGKLSRYLDRKLRERGWAGAGEARDAAGQAASRMAELGYVDDGAYAAGRARTFAARGFGPRRLSADLMAAGVGEEQRAAAAGTLDAGAAALRFAEKRRIGPFATERADPKAREKQLSAMLRAGHSMADARRILACRPGEMPDFS